jgi:hypothetical protein
VGILSSLLGFLTVPFVTGTGNKPRLVTCLLSGVSLVVGLQSIARGVTVSFARSIFANAAAWTYHSELGLLKAIMVG